MVNRGFSRSCHRCRGLHTRCDQTRPACGRCVAHGVRCPGYRDVDGFLFKDLSSHLAHANGRLRRCKSQTWTATITYGEMIFETTPTTDLHLLKSAHMMAPVRRWLDDYMNVPKRNSNTDRGHFTNLAGLLSHTPPSSALSLAMHAMIQRSSSFTLDQSPFPRQDDAMLKALKALRAATKDSSANVRIETLQAILLLHFTDYLTSISRGTPGRLIPTHINGLQALLRSKGDAARDDADLSSLSTAARNCAIKYILFQPSDTDFARSFFRLDEPRSPTHTNSAVALDDILVKVLELRHFLQQAEYTAPKNLAPGKRRTLPDDFSLESEVDTLIKRLQSWIHNVPSSWHPGPDFLGVSESSSTRFQGAELFTSPDVAYLYNQWRCVYLMVLGLARACNPKAEDEIIRIYNAISASASFFLREDDEPKASPPSPRRVQGRTKLSTWFFAEILSWVIFILNHDHRNLHRVQALSSVHRLRCLYVGLLPSFDVEEL